MPGSTLGYTGWWGVKWDPWIGMFMKSSCNCEGRANLGNSAMGTRAGWGGQLCLFSLWTREINSTSQGELLWWFKESHSLNGHLVSTCWMLGFELWIQHSPWWWLGEGGGWTDKYTLLVPRAEAVTRGAHGPDGGGSRRSRGWAGAQQAEGMDNVPEKQPGMMVCFVCQLRGGTGCPENWRHIISGCVWGCL